MASSKDGKPGDEETQFQPGFLTGLSYLSLLEYGHAFRRTGLGNETPDGNT
jgi:hypothetical protein